MKLNGLFGSLALLFSVSLFGCGDTSEQIAETPVDTTTNMIVTTNDATAEFIETTTDATENTESDTLPDSVIFAWFSEATFPGSDFLDRPYTMMEAFEKAKFSFDYEKTFILKDWHRDDIYYINLTGWYWEIPPTSKDGWGLSQGVTGQGTMRWKLDITTKTVTIGDSYNTDTMYKYMLTYLHEPSRLLYCN